MDNKLEIKPLQAWGINPARPLVIAGPCSAETEEQMLTTARGIDTSIVQIFRAGIWKPRTRPGAFEGIGSVGLEWLKMVKAETGLKTSTEVANVKHVYESLKAGVDILWIGARTTVNPFAVQEIADALKGVDIPVMVKNPVNPDLALWIGAIERLNKAGITRLAAIHRGFSAYGNSKYRNPPHWQLAIDLKRAISNIPIINDPSHISGNASLIPAIAQKAMDLNFDGLIIETHCTPAQAWSDKAQQITPFELKELIQSLVLRKENPENKAALDTLEELRTKIDHFDDELLEILARRMEVVNEIGILKRDTNISIYQSSRFDSLLRHAIENGERMGLSGAFVEQIVKLIHQESINHQMQIMNAGAAINPAAHGSH